MVVWEYTLLFILYIIERTDGSRTVRTQQFVSRSSLVKVQKHIYQLKCLCVLSADEVKRGWNNFAAGYGKRAWNSGFSSGMGKRAAYEVQIIPQNCRRTN